MMMNRASSMQTTQSCTTWARLAYLWMNLEKVQCSSAKGTAAARPGAGAGDAAWAGPASRTRATTSPQRAFRIPAAVQEGMVDSSLQNPVAQSFPSPQRQQGRPLLALRAGV